MVDADKLAQNSGPNTPPAPSGPLLTLAQIDAMPDLEYLIEGVLPEKSFCVLYGEPGSGKTFVALSMALALTSGSPWIGRKTRRANILYIAAEGVYGMKYRVRAYRNRNKIDPVAVMFYKEAVQVTDPTACEALQSVLGSVPFTPGLIIIDTLARVAVSKDENSARDMGEIVAGIEVLRRAYDAGILLIHHSGKKSDAERGSSALRGAADVMIKCEKSDFENVVILKCSKVKDDEPFPDLEIGLEKVELANKRSSLVAGAAPPIAKRTRKSGGNKSASKNHCENILEILARDFASNGATQGELDRRSREQLKISELTFDRTWRDVIGSDRVRKEGDGRGARYFAVGVGVKSVSNGVNDKP